MVDSQVLQPGRQTKIGSRNLSLSLRNRESKSTFELNKSKGNNFWFESSGCLSVYRNISEKLRKMRTFSPETFYVLIIYMEKLLSSDWLR